MALFWAGANQDERPSSTGGRLSPTHPHSWLIQRGKNMNWNWAIAGALTTLVMGPWNFGMAGERPVFRAQNGVAYPADSILH